MKRFDLETLCIQALYARKPVRLVMRGTPDARRVRLFGHQRGPYGKVVNWQGNDIIAEFDPEHVLNCLDNIPLEVYQ